LEGPLGVQTAIFGHQNEKRTLKNSMGVAADGYREWDEGMLTSGFLPHDAAEVHKIRLSYRMDDTIAWFYERIGLFTVRSAYKLAVALDQKEEP
jgi:hypothetical protein